MASDEAHTGLAIGGPSDGHAVTFVGTVVNIPVRTGPNNGEGDRGYSFGTYAWNGAAWIYDGPQEVRQGAVFHE